MSIKTAGGNSGAIGFALGSGNFSNPSQTMNPGLITKEDAGSAADLAKLVNLLSAKFPRDGEGTVIGDTNTGPLAKAPGEVLARGANSVKREEPFKIDEVKASSFLLKKIALFDPNIDPYTPDARNPGYSVVSKVGPSVETGLNTLLNKAPFLGDFAANSATGNSQGLYDQRQYGKAPYNDFSGVSGGGKTPLDQQNPARQKAIGNPSLILKSRKVEGDADVSSSFMPNDPGLLKAALSPPMGLPLSDEEWNNPYEDDNLESHKNIKINKTTVRQTRPGAGLSVVKKGTFLTRLINKK